MPSRKTVPAAVAPPPTSAAVRLIFEYDGDEVRLVSQQPVDMAVTGADLAQAHHAGMFVDARDKSNRTVARVHAHGAGENTVEVFPEKAGEPITRVPIARPRGAFSVVLPAPKAAARVAVVRVQPGAAPPAAPGARAPEGAARAAPELQTTELASFALQRKP